MPEPTPLIIWEPIQIDQLSTMFAQCVSIPGGAIVIEVENKLTDPTGEGLAILHDIATIVSHPYEEKTLLKKLSKYVTATVRSLIVVRYDRNIVRLTVLGNGTIYLLRGKNILPLLQKQGSVVGKVQPGDRIVVVSQSLAKWIRPQHARLLDASLSAKEQSEAISLSGNPGEGSGTGCVFAVEKGELQDDVTLPAAVDTTSPPIRRRFTWSIPHLPMVSPMVFLRAQEYRKKRRLGLAVVTILAFSISVLLGVQRQKQDARRIEASKVYAQALNEFNEAQSLMESDGQQARDMLRDAELLLTPYSESTLPPGKELRDILELKESVATALLQAEKRFAVQAPLFYDPSFLRSDSTAELLAASEDYLVYLDKDNGLLSLVSISSKEGQVITRNDALRQATALAVQDKRILVANADGVTAYSEDTPNGEKEIDAAEIEGAVIGLGTYGANIYIATDQGELWRFVPDANNTSVYVRQKYLASDTVLETDAMGPMQVDGSVYLGSSGGEIYRYTQGRPDGLVFRNIPGELAGELQIAAIESSPYLFVLDKTGRRIIKVTPSGVYEAQYELPDMPIESLYAIDQGKRLLLLSNGVIHQLPVE